MLFELDWRHAEFQFGAVPVEEVLSGVKGERSSGELLFELQKVNYIQTTLSLF